LIGMSFSSFFVSVTAITGGIGGAENRLRNYAMISLGFSGSSFVGPMAAGFSIDHLGHLPTFMLLASFTLPPLLLLLFRDEILPHAGKQEGGEGKRNILDLWRIPALRNTFIASGIISSASDLYQFYMPIYGHAIGLSASAIGTVVAFCALAAFIIRIALPRLTKLSNESRILTYAIFVAAGAFMLFPFFQNAYVLAAVAFLLGLGLGCGLPMSMSLVYALSPHGRTAESSGLRATVNNFTHIVIPLVFGSLGAAFGFFPVFLTNSAILVAGGIIMRRNRPPDPGA
jgi:predicted MFS family arabinose efflux permease